MSDFKCEECNKETLLLYYLSEYGCRAKNTKDDGEYCKECFDNKFEEKHGKNK